MKNYKYVCLAGGVGGAKLADGLAQIISPENLTIVVNTGDDFEHLGLTICPDLDTVMYTLGDVANKETGWGRAGESWCTMAEVGRLQGPDWFSLGDIDLATHLVRTHMLRKGETLTAVTRHLHTQLNIQANVIPMSNQPAPTMIVTDDGILPFQEWFVRERWQPVVREVRLPETVHASPQVAKALEAADFVLIAPSNPFVSVAPILNVYPIREMMLDLPRAVVAVSPIVGGAALKGPAGKMMQEMDMPVSATAVAQYYGELIDGFVYDQRDSDPVSISNLATLCTDTIMHNRSDRVRFAEEVLAFCDKVAE